MDIHTLIADVIAREGGYKTHPADRGGPTNWEATRAVAIYRRLYRDQPGHAFVAETAPSIAAERFDTAVNMGVATATGFLQRARKAGEAVRGERYIALAESRPANAAFLCDWLANRIGQMAMNLPGILPFMNGVNFAALRFPGTV